jgi:hypothetical protein
MGLHSTMGDAAACDVCMRLGHDQFHALSLGGDDFQDARFAASDPADDGIATAQFVIQGGKWPQPGGLGSPVTLTYSFQNMFDGGLLMPNGQPLPAYLIRNSINEALGVWASVAPLHFVEVQDEGGPVSMENYPNGQFGQIRFKHLYINGPDPPPPQSPIAKALAYFPNSGGNRAGDVFFDNGDPWQQIGTLPQPDILGAAIHEIGHTLGLGHTDLPQANMYWIFTRYSGPGTGALHSDDIAGIRTVYGAGVGSVTPLATVPEPAAWVIATSVGIAWLAVRRRRRTTSTLSEQVV